MEDDTLDPQGLIREAYRIDGISPSECRGIFFDWALHLPDGTDTGDAIRALLARFGAADHPMTQVLRAGLERYAGPGGRRGGWRGRRAGPS